MNHVTLIGNLGKDPELRETKGGTAVCTFSVATIDKVKKGDDWEKVTDWHNCVAFGRTADAINSYMTKGSKIALTGKIKTDTYEKNGEKRYATKIIVDNFEFVDSKKTQDAHVITAKTMAADDAIPF
jgi:single-strand DNA-binding protein